jgi:hypothetical protein
MEDLSVDGRVIFKLILRNRFEDVDWIQLAQDRIQWLDLVNTSMNLRIP